MAREGVARDRSFQDPGSRELGLLAALLVLAFVLRWIHWRQTAVLFNDGPVFLDLAHAFARGDWRGALAHPFHPLYPVAVAVVSPLFRDPETAAVVVSAGAGTLAVGALFAFLRSAFGPGPAWVGAFFLTVHERAIEFTGDVQSEGLYLACFLGAIAALWRALVGGRVGFALLGGALAGLAYLTRPEGLGLVVVALGLAAVQLGTGALAPARFLRLAGAVALAAGVLVAPYVVVLRVETGQWLLTQKKAVGHLVGVTGEHQGLPPPTRLPVSIDYVGPGQAPPPAARHTARRPGQAAPPAATARPSPPVEAGPPIEPDPEGLGAAAVDLLRRAVSSLRWTAFYLLVGVVACLGRPGLRGGLVLGVVGLYGLVLLGLEANVGYLSRRHVFPPLAATFGYAALGLLVFSRVASRILAPLSSRVTPAWVAAILLAAIAGFAGTKALKPQRLEGLAERRAAEWLREHDPAPDLVAARRRRVAYYAGARYVPIPGEASGRLDALRRSGARYLVLDDAKLGLYPGLDAAVPRMLQPLHQAHAAGRAASVYALTPR
jgi:hypothetical protein